MGSLCARGTKSEPINTDDLKYDVYDIVIDDEKYNNCKHEINDDGSLTFYPSPHLTANDLCTTLLPTTSFLNSQKLKNIKQKIEYSKLEAIYDFDAKIIDDYTCNISSFILAALKAFNSHYPFKISPNNIFLLILQAIAINVDKNAEKLRDKYVTHNGKMKLTVIRDSRYFILRQQKQDNDWNSVVREFVEQIDKNTVSDTTQLMEADFSDSTIIDKISNKICIMDICKNYFEYEFLCYPLCGFPKITLTANKQDWMKLKEKVDKLLSTKVDKKWGENWKNALLPLLDRFIDAFDGEIDGLFWNSMIKHGVTKREIETSGSGSVYQREEWFSGWFNILFPYICTNDGNFVENDYCKRFSKDADYAKNIKSLGTGNDVKVYPIGLSSAPVKMMYIDDKTKEQYDYDMKFMSGIIGYNQCPKTFEIQLVTGWIIGFN